MTAPNAPTNLSVTQDAAGDPTTTLSFNHDGENLDRVEILRKLSGESVWSSYLLAPQGDFGGEVPTAPTFNRDSVAYKQDGTEVAADEPRYEDAQHGQGVMVEEGTTNLLTVNQSKPTDDTGWNVDQGAKAFSPIEGGSVELTPNGVATSGAYWSNPKVNVVAGQAYSFQAKVRASAAGRRGRITLSWRDAANAVITTESAVFAPLTQNALTRLLYENRVAPASATGVYIYVFVDVAAGGNVPAADRYYLTYVQSEQKAYATSWQIGGTARAAETLTVPTDGVLDASEGTVEGWFYEDGIAAPGSGSHLWDTTLAAGRFYAREVAGQYQFAFNGATAHALSFTTPAEGWHHVAVKWGEGSITSYLDGVPKGTASVAVVLTGVDLFRLGHNINSAAQWNNPIDDLRISNIARTDAEIAEVAASGSPAPADGNTTYKLPLDSNLNRPTYRSIKVATPVGTSWAVRGLSAAGEVST